MYKVWYKPKNGIWVNSSEYDKWEDAENKKKDLEEKGNSVVIVPPRNLDD